MDGKTSNVLNQIITTRMEVISEGFNKHGGDMNLLLRKLLLTQPENFNDTFNLVNVRFKQELIIMVHTAF